MISINYNFTKISKRKALNSVLTIDQVMNDVNTWNVDEDCDRDEAEDYLDDLCRELEEENENNGDPKRRNVDLILLQESQE